MSRTGAKVQRSEDGPFGYAISTIPGSIRNPDDADGIDVELSIQGAEVTLRADGSDLGNWPLDAVRVHPIDTTSYEFLAEGDRLIFVPEDRTALVESPLVDRPPPKTAKVKRREEKKADKERAKAEKLAAEEVKDRAKADKAAAKQQKKTDKVRATEEKAAAKHQKAASKRDAASEPARKRRKGKSKAASTDVDVPEATGAEESPDASIADSAMATTIAHEEEPADTAALPKVRRVGRKRRERKEEDPKSNEDQSQKETKRKRAWISAIDVARRYDIFHLDRVQVNERMRGQEHDHTWDHRTAASYGLGAHLCTICGKIRLKT